VVVRLATVREGSAVCRYCSGRPGGTDLFDYRKPATLYLIVHDRLMAAKIGVTHKANSRRMRKHRELGWRVLKTWRLRCGADAVLLEADVVNYWRKSGATETLDSWEMPQAGHSETAFLRDIDLKATMAVVKPGRLPKRQLA
jgi:hypothetical protein